MAKIGRLDNRRSKAKVSAEMMVHCPASPATFGDPRLPFNSPNPIDQHTLISQTSNGQISVDLTLNSRPKHIAPPTHALSKTARKTNKNTYLRIDRGWKIDENSFRWSIGRLDQANRARIGTIAREIIKEREREREICQMGGEGSPARLPTPFYIFGFIYLFFYLLILTFLLF